MELLFQRNQGIGRLGRINFTLWGKIELTEDEQAIVSRYQFDQAVMIEVVQPALLKKSALLSLVVFVLSYVVFGIVSSKVSLVLGLLTAGGFGYWYFNEKRETIFVKDLLHGRNFKCDSVVELARKEAWLTTVVSFLRQVMESAKHWDGTETISIEALPKDEARQVIIKGI
ncbi:MAG: hypothetical protein ABW116_01475 [Candidatus Sedimenticola sp. 20ELBAFRAG]